MPKLYGFFSYTKLEIGYNKNMNKNVILVAIGVLIFLGLKKLTKNVKYYLSGDDIHTDLSLKMKTRLWTLNQKDLMDFTEAFSEEEQIAKKSEWANGCDDKLDYNCRYLVDYKYALGKKEKALKEALNYCKSNSINACIAATKMDGFNNSHKEFFSVTNQIISICQDEYANLSDSQYWACDYYK